MVLNRFSFPCFVQDQPLLWIAVDQNKPKTVLWLLAHKANADCVCPRYRRAKPDPKEHSSPLILCASRGYESLITPLVMARADIDRRDKVRKGTRDSDVVLWSRPRR